MKRVQITIEYLLFLALMILVLLYMTVGKNSKLEKGVTKFTNETQNEILNMLN